MSEMIITEYGDARIVELWDDVMGLPAYAVYKGKNVYLFTGETAYADADRCFFDFVIPMVHGGKNV